MTSVPNEKLTVRVGDDALVDPSFEDSQVRMECLLQQEAQGLGQDRISSSRTETRMKEVKKKTSNPRRRRRRRKTNKRVAKRSKRGHEFEIGTGKGEELVEREGAGEALGLEESDEDQVLVEEGGERRPEGLAGEAGGKVGLPCHEAGQQGIGVAQGQQLRRQKGLLRVLFHKVRR